MTNNQLKGLQS